MAAAPGVFAQQTAPGRNRHVFYEKGPVRIRYEEAGSGFPLLIIPGGGLNSVMAGLATSPFNPIEEFKGEYRCIAADLRNAIPGQSSGPLEIDRPWDSHTDDQLGLLDHLGVDKFMVMGFCIGGPFIWNLLKRAPDRVVAAVPAQPVGFRPEMPNALYDNSMNGWGAELVKRRPEITMEMVEKFLTNDVPQERRLRLHRDARFRAQLPDARADPAGRHPGASLRGRHGVRDARAEGRSEHVPVEGAQGADSAGGAPDTFLPQGASARFCLAGAIHTTGRQPHRHCEDPSARLGASSTRYATKQSRTTSAGLDCFASLAMTMKRLRLSHLLTTYHEALRIAAALPLRALEFRLLAVGQGKAKAEIADQTP